MQNSLSQCWDVVSGCQGSAMWSLGRSEWFLACCYVVSRVFWVVSLAHIKRPHLWVSIAPFTQRFRKICICSRIVRFAAFTLPVIFRNLCVHSHTTCKDPVKTRDLSCDVYNAPLTISLNWRMISASARIVRSSLIAASFQFTYFSSCERWSAFKTLWYHYDILINLSSFNIS